MLRQFALSFGVTVLCVSIAAIAVYRIFIFAPGYTYVRHVSKTLCGTEESNEAFNLAAALNLSSLDELRHSDESTPSWGPLRSVMAKNNPPDRNDHYTNGYCMLLEYEEYAEIQEPVIVQAPRRPSVALTFDDGPGNYTLQILNTLARHNANATFFVLGRNLERNRGTALRIFESGNELSNHAFNHRRLIPPMAEEQIVQEILSTSAAIEEITGVPSSPMFRPPYGVWDDGLIRISYEIGYAIILWDTDPFDWLYLEACHIYYHIMGRVRDGAIIVLHDIYRTTAEAMERVVPGIIQLGFDLVTVSELIYRRHGRAPLPGQIYSSGR